MRNISIISLIIIILNSCTYKQNVTFNKDWSGEMSCEIDMSMMSALAGDSVPMPSLIEDSSSQAKLEQLKKIPGISNIKMSDNGGGIYAVSYNFKDLSALNKSGNALFSDEEIHKNYTYFQIKKKNTLYFSFPITAVEQTPEEEEANIMGESFEYELTLSFPNKVKSVTTKNGAIVSDDRKQVSFKTNISAMTAKGYSPEMLIKFDK